MEFARWVNEYGLGVGAMSLAGIIVKWLLTYVNKMHDDFTNVLNNHINTNTAALQDLTVCIKELREQLKKNGGTR